MDYRKIGIYLCLVLAAFAYIIPALDIDRFEIQLLSGIVSIILGVVLWKNASNKERIILGTGLFFSTLFFMMLILLFIIWPK